MKTRTRMRITIVHGMGVFHQKTMLLFLIGGFNGRGIWFSAIQCFPSVVEPIFYTPPHANAILLALINSSPILLTTLKVRNALTQLTAPALSIWKMVCKCNDGFTYYSVLSWGKLGNRLEFDVVAAEFGGFREETHISWAVGSSARVALGRWSLLDSEAIGNNSRSRHRLHPDWVR